MCSCTFKNDGGSVQLVDEQPIGLDVAFGEKGSFRHFDTFAGMENPRWGRSGDASPMTATEGPVLRTCEKNKNLYPRSWHEGTRRLK